MNWRYDNPIVNKQYICCVKGWLEEVCPLLMRQVEHQEHSQSDE